MRFDGVPLKNVLDSIGKNSGLKLRPWKDEGIRKVTIDVGGKTVDEALKGRELSALRRASQRGAPSGENF